MRILYITWSVVSAVLFVYGVLSIINMGSKRLQSAAGRKRNSAWYAQRLLLLYLFCIIGNTVFLWFRDKPTATIFFTFAFLTTAGIPITLFVHRKRPIKIMNQMQVISEWGDYGYLRHEDILINTEGKTFGYSRKYKEFAQMLHMFFGIGLFFLILALIVGMTACVW